MNNQNQENQQEQLKQAMLNLFQTIGLSEYIIHSIPTVLSINNGGRTGYIVFVKNTEQGSISKVYVDLIEGKPTHEQYYEQFYDATYHFGADCKHKVVLVSTERKGDTDADALYELTREDVNKRIEVKYIMQHLVRRNNRCGISTYLACTDSGLKSGSHFFLSEAPESSEFNVLKEVPSEERLRWNNIEETCSMEIHGVDYTFFENIYFDIKDYRTEITNLWIKPYITTRWTEDGLFLYLKRDDDSGEFLLELWNAKERVIKERYGELKANFDETDYKISIKISAIPLSNFIYSSFDNQCKLIMYYHKEIDLFVKFMDLIIAECRG